MSILSTSAKLVKVGQDYSAGNGISIDNYVISVTSSLTGEYATQSAFDELNDSFSTLSSNLNSNSGIWVDVASTYQTNSSTYLTAHQSLNGYATEQWVEDKGYITGVDLTPYQEKSGMVDYQTTAGMTAYATTSDVANKLDTTAFSDVSGTFLTAHQTIPSAKWETASDVVQSNSAQWSENTGDEEVNNAVYNNSAKWNEISVYESNSSTYLTAHQSLDGYATQDWVTEQGYITGVDLSDYAKTSAVHNDIDCAISGKLDTTAFSTVSGDFLTAHQDISYKLDSSAFSDVSGTFLTAVNIPESANWNETTSVVESNSAAWGNEFDPSYMSGAIDNKLNTSSFADVSGSFLTAINIPESANWNEATTAYQTNSGTYLTAHQDISNLMPKSESANFYPMTGNPSGYLTEHQSLDGYATEDWVTGQGYITGVNIPESGTWNDVASTYQTNSGTYLTAHQSLSDYATTSELNSISSYLSGAIDYVSANAGSTLPSAFEVDEDGQAYKVSAYTSAMNPEPTGFDNGVTYFGINDIGAYVYTTNIRDGRWQLDGGEGGNISDNTIDLTDVSESTWEHSTQLTVQDFSYPFQEATLSTTIDVVDKTPYLLSGQGGGITGDYVSGVNIVSGTAAPFGTICTATEISGDVKVSVWRSILPGTATYSLLDIGRSVTTIQSSSANWNEVSNKVDLSAFDELKASYDALSSLFATYSGQWLLPNEGVQSYVLSSMTANVEINDGSWDHDGDFGMTLPAEVSAFTEGLEQGALTAIIPADKELNKAENIRFGYSKYNLPDDFCGTWASYGTGEYGPEITAVLSGFGDNSAAPTGYPVYMGFPYLFRSDAGYGLTGIEVTFSGYVPA